MLSSFPWKTPEEWGGHCRMAVVREVQGSAVGVHPHLAGASSSTALVSPRAGAGPQHWAHCPYQPPANSCWAQKLNHLFKRVLQSTFRGVGCQSVPHSSDLRWNRRPPYCLLCLCREKSSQGSAFHRICTHDNPFGYLALLSSADHPLFPSLTTGSWNTASHWRLLWALTLYQVVQQEPRQSHSLGQ